MRTVQYPLARARRVRARRAAWNGSSFLLCAGLAFVFVLPLDGGSTGSSTAPTLEVAPAQAMVAAVAAPPRHIALPADRVMTVPAEVNGGTIAADVWSTPLSGDEPAPAAVEPAVLSVEAPALVDADVTPEPEKPNLPTVLFEQASLADQALPAETSALPAPPAAVAARPAAASVAAPPAPITLRTLAGKWAPHPSACSDRGSKRLAFLPLVLDERGARAGSASCSFRRTDQDAKGWSVNATCTDASESWNAHVRLALAGKKLTWSSERGTQTYSRCP